MSVCYCFFLSASVRVSPNARVVGAIAIYPLLNDCLDVRYRVHLPPSPVPLSHCKRCQHRYADGCAHAVQGLGGLFPSIVFGRNK